MLLDENPRTQTCRQKAAEAHERALRTSDPYLRSAYATIERSWSRIAESIALADHVTAAMNDVPRRGIPLQTCWRCHARMRLSVINNFANYDRIFFECQNCGFQLTSTERR
jgi:hypothetical protein